jgi:hypothetical protein
MRASFSGMHASGVLAAGGREERGQFSQRADFMIWRPGQAFARLSMAVTPDDAHAEI